MYNIYFTHSIRNSLQLLASFLGGMDPSPVTEKPILVLFKEEYALRIDASKNLALTTKQRWLFVGLIFLWIWTILFPSIKEASLYIYLPPGLWALIGALLSYYVIPGIRAVILTWDMSDAALRPPVAAPGQVQN